MSGMAALADVALDTLEVSTVDDVEVDGGAHPGGSPASPGSSALERATAPGSQPPPAAPERPSPPAGALSRRDPRQGYLKRCARCELEKRRCSDFERWDAVCMSCRAGKAETESKAKPSVAAVKLRGRERIMVSLRNVDLLGDHEIARRCACSAHHVRDTLARLRAKGVEVLTDHQAIQQRPTLSKTPRPSGRRAQSRHAGGIERVIA